MRIKLPLSIALCLLLFACPSSNDDAVQTANITKTNYAYEGDLYRYALSTEIDALNAQIEIWEQQGEENEGDIENANIRIEEANGILQNTPEGISFGLPPIPIPPIPPIPCLCFDLFQDFNYIVTDANTLALTATIINDNEEEIYTTNNNAPLNTEGFKGDLLAYTMEPVQGEFIGNGFLTINKILSDESVITYSIPVIINELP